MNVQPRRFEACAVIGLLSVPAVLVITALTWDFGVSFRIAQLAAIPYAAVFATVAIRRMRGKTLTRRDSELVAWGYLSLCVVLGLLNAVWPK
jgi:hypothetical protein